MPRPSALPAVKPGAQIVQPKGVVTKLVTSPAASNPPSSFLTKSPKSSPPTSTTSTSKPSSQFLTRSPKSSPPTSRSNSSTKLSSKSTAAEKNAILTKCHDSLEGLAKHYEQIMEGVDMAAPSPDMIKLANMSVTKPIDDAIRGTTVPNSATMKLWSTNASKMPVNLFPVFLRNAAVHCKTLPMRPIDFVDVDLPKLSKTVELIALECKKNVTRCKSEVSKIKVETTEATPLGKIIDQQFKGKLATIAKQEWAKVGGNIDGSETGRTNAKRPPETTKHDDNRSESCVIS
ncbi:hypothetical protein TrST_g10402 [Triparma strigata]|uniref:Uncharacterized protein n=1 Tax=Triparma strigata TaxID=1606541 RepID=A0A9W7C3V2_9STRA|nr:hypothetical protein TrST_g10402 [Triparma strigata]